MGDSPPPREDRRIFEATVVAINISDRRFPVEVLGLETADGSAGFADRAQGNVREISPGGDVTLVVAEDATDFDMRSGVRGYVELATGPRDLQRHHRAR
jgi:hypothetical protein